MSKVPNVGSGQGGTADSFRGKPHTTEALPTSLIALDNGPLFVYARDAMLTGKGISVLVAIVDTPHSGTGRAWLLNQ